MNIKEIECYANENWHKISEGIDKEFAVVSNFVHDNQKKMVLLELKTGRFFRFISTGCNLICEAEIYTSGIHILFDQNKDCAFSSDVSQQIVKLLQTMGTIIC